MPHDLSTVPSDEELACRARRGCAGSFEQLVRRYQTPVLHFLQHRGAGADADDLLQETFLRALANLARYREQWRFATWLFTIARRISINHHRRPRRAKDGEALDRIASAAPDPAQIAAEEEDRQELWGMAARILSEEEMTAVWLYYVEEMPAREIASVLGRTWVGVKTILFRARRRLLPLLEPLQAGGSPARRSASRDRMVPVGVPSMEVPHA
jgi:RNA polymerase sigma-70 factor (ECF subfamily)